MEVLVLLALLAVVVVLVVLASYNGLMALRQEVRDAWGQMDEALKQRSGLVPKLSTQHAAGGGDPAAMTAVLTAKNQAAVAFNPQQLAAAEAALSAAIDRMLREAGDATAEGPVSLGRELASCERRIGQAREQYNQAVASFNAALGSFPHELVARAARLQPQPVFEWPTPAGERAD